MTIWISLLRGVNVGGKNILPMQELRNLIVELGYLNVKTYIQSGNCIFKSNQSEALVISGDIAQGIENRFGFKVSVLTISDVQLLRAIKQNPYSTESNEPRNIHFFFLSEDAKSVDEQALNRLKHSSEHFTLTKHVFYLLAPEGIARSRLAAGVEARIGVPVTARNCRTVGKLADIVKQL